MKKLMIAAVAVAAATVASAVDMRVSDFTATVKTTKAKAGSAQTSAVNLGVDDFGTFWYTDATNGWLSTQVAYTNKVLRGHTIPCFVKNNGAIVYLTGADEAAANNALRYLGRTYDNKSAGAWCETVKFVDAAACFRVAGTEKATWTLVQSNDCCSTSGQYFVYDLDNDVAIGAIDYGTAGLLQRFGAQAENRANKCELFATVAGVPFNSTRFMVLGTLAGQGSYDVNNDLVTSVSGNIVGMLTAPMCENCCWAPDPAVAFDCNGVAVLPLTAAYGSFRIKRNARLDFTK